VRGAWVRYVRQQNLDILGETTDLNEFPFGSERARLAVVRPVLMDLQHGRCFYCRNPLTLVNTHVDHFVPWARYPVDLGHNFVLADSRCNGKKRDRLPACAHLKSWTERNTRFGDQIRKALEEKGMVSELAASNQVAHWAYSQTEAATGLTWLKADELVPIGVDCRLLLQ
jgi:5-methylcytosine-specific restriction endonuclease McrA